MTTMNVMKTAQLNLSSNIIYRNNILSIIGAVVAKKNTSATSKSAITKFPSFMCILLCRRRKNNNGKISSAVEFPALVFNINRDHMPYDLFAAVHHKPTKGGNDHYTAISRSWNLESQEWFMYDDDRVSSSKFTKMHNKNTMVK